MANIDVLAVNDLVKQYQVRDGGLRRAVITPVNDVSFTLAEGRTTALVGESGSGKSTLSRAIMGLERPDAGTIILLGKRIDDLSARLMRPHRRHVQMVFQNPLRSFDPARTIGASICEVLALDPDADPRADIPRLLQAVGLHQRFAELYPRRVSGGELQRAAIARAISVRPAMLVLDEPTSALDVSVQARVLALLGSLQDQQRMSYLLATHDLRVVRSVAHETLVLYRGRVVEHGPTGAVFADPGHPYTRRLLMAERGILGSADAGVMSWAEAARLSTAPFVQVSPGHWVRDDDVMKEH